jgi:hypothetical protein
VLTGLVTVGTDYEKIEETGGSVRGTILLLLLVVVVVVVVLGQHSFTVLKVPRQYPLVLLGWISRKQGRALGREEGSVMGSRLLGVRNRTEHLGLIICLEGNILTRV